MSEAKPTTDNPVAEAESEAVEIKPVKVEMTAEAYQKWEREVQLGVTDKMPDGRLIKEVQAEYEKQQLEQEKARIEAALPKKEQIVDDATVVPNEVAPGAMMEVVIHPNGVVSASPKVEAEAKSAPVQTGDGDGEKQEPDNDLPNDFPARDKLLAAGHTSLEAVAKFTLEDLINITGIKGATAEKILAYGKSA